MWCSLTYKFALMKIGVSIYMMNVGYTNDPQDMTTVFNNKNNYTTNFAKKLTGTFIMSTDVY